MSGSFMRLSDKKIIKPEVMLIEKSGVEYLSTYQSIGTAFTYQGD